LLEQKEHKFDVLGRDFDIKNIGKVTGEEKYSCKNIYDYFLRDFLKQKS
jgi:hypothetical protein